MIWSIEITILYDVRFTQQKSLSSFWNIKREKTELFAAAVTCDISPRLIYSAVRFPQLLFCMQCQRPSLCQAFWVRELLWRCGCRIQNTMECDVTAFINELFIKLHIFTHVNIDRGKMNLLCFNTCASLLEDFLS